MYGSVQYVVPMSVNFVQLPYFSQQLKRKKRAHMEHSCNTNARDKCSVSMDMYF